MQTKSPAGAIQWIPADGQASNLVPDAHDPSKRHAPIMFTTDLSLKFDPSYRAIAKRFQENPKEFELAFAKAWFKLTHRDMGPRARYLGDEVPAEVLLWQDPVPAVDHELIDAGDIAEPEVGDPRVRADRPRARQDRLGIGLLVPRNRHARRRERGADSSRAAEGLGSQRSDGAGEGARDARAHPERSTARKRAASRSRWPT